jgi:hypothetical protein
MPDTETLDIPLSGINPDLQLPLNSGELTHYLKLAASAESPDARPSPDVSPRG